MKKIIVCMVILFNVIFAFPDGNTQCGVDEKTNVPYLKLEDEISTLVVGIQDNRIYIKTDNLYTAVRGASMYVEFVTKKGEYNAFNLVNINERIPLDNSNGTYYVLCTPKMSDDDINDFLIWWSKSKLCRITVRASEEENTPSFISLAYTLKYSSPVIKKYKGLVNGTITYSDFYEAKDESLNYCTDSLMDQLDGSFEDRD